MGHNNDRIRAIKGLEWDRDLLATLSKASGLNVVSLKIYIFEVAGAIDLTLPKRST